MDAKAQARTPRDTLALALVIQISPPLSSSHLWRNPLEPLDLPDRAICRDASQRRETSQEKI